jgi:hypothetical protein
MTDVSLKQRVAALEQQVAELRAQQVNGTRRKDWHSTVGIFTDNAGMLELFAEAQRLRQADRKKTLRRQTTRRRSRS